MSGSFQWDDPNSWKSVAGRGAVDKINTSYAGISWEIRKKYQCPSSSLCDSTFIGNLWNHQFSYLGIGFFKVPQWFWSIAEFKNHWLISSFPLWAQKASCLFPPLEPLVWVSHASSSPGMGGKSTCGDILIQA